MATKANQEKVEGRFDKVLSYYWDGVPVPLLTDTDKNRTQTFVCRQLAFTPDYHGETVSVSLIEPVQSTLFGPLSTQVVGPQPASCRIGSHYSLYVGLFRFTEEKPPSKNFDVSERVAVRVPIEYCEKLDECTGEIFAAHCRVRTEKLVMLYKPLIKEHLPLSRNSLRNIIILSSRGCTSVPREIIAREISDVNEEYANALSEAIFYYMCLNPLQRRILEPLQLATAPENSVHSLRVQPQADKGSLQQNFSVARQQLKAQLFWNAATREYFAALQTLWESKFSRLSFLNTDVFSNTVGVAGFIGQLSNSVRFVLSRIRIEFYTNVEDFFFSLIPTAKAALLISESEYEKSIFRRIFVATEIFLTNKLRSLVFDSLDRLVEYLNCDGCGGVARVSRRANQRSFIGMDLLASESFQPRAPSMALLLFGIRDLFAEVEDGINNLPSVGCVILRTLKLERKKITVVSRVEMASYRASIAEILNEVMVVIDCIVSSYKDFCAIPVQNLSAVKGGSEAQMTAHVKFAREQIRRIYRASQSRLYCGRFELSCAALQDSLAREWQNYLAALTVAYQKTILSIAENAKTRSSAVFKILGTIPSNVEELESHLSNMEAAKLLAQELRNIDCKSVLDRVACMEELCIPIEQDICNAVFELIKMPDELHRGAEKAGDVRTRCAPLLRRKVNELRAVTQEYMQTLSTGVTELYHLFNLETCDIAAQTCAELRELVDRIDINLKKITHEEEVLGLTAEDTFENFPSLLHYFEVIEQFWNAIFDAAKLRDMYNSPISSMNATASVEKVREWRRLIHSSARHLRGFPLLVQLGREQEVALSKYEELELFFEVVSSPNLRKNHWKDIAKLIAAQLREDVASVLDLSITVKRLLEAGLMEHMGPLGQIANQAHCDYEVETELEEMKSYGKRTHFVFEDLCDGEDSMSFVAQRFISEAAAHVEQFVIRCRAMRRYPNLGQFVHKPLLEWEFSCEKSCEMLAAFDFVQERCAWMKNCLQTLQMPQSRKGSADRIRHAVVQHLLSVSEAVKRLHTTLRKPQFSLYTAMVQDTIQDGFFVVKTALEDVVELFRQTLDQRRAAYPRFRFLSDNQLVNFQFVLVRDSVVPLFPCLYSQLTDVVIKEGDVTTVIAVDGASLPLLSPLPLATASPDSWLAQIDRIVRRSLLAAVKNCVAAYYSTDLETWVSAWCGQVVVLALRILHTEGFRHALQIGGTEALQAYGSKVFDVCCALSQLALEFNDRRTDEVASGSTSNGGADGCIRAALAYEQFAFQETKLAMEWGVRSVVDLDLTAFLQTSITPSGDSIRVTFMGTFIEYGLEFLGHSGAPLMSSTQWKQMAMVLADVELGRSIPLVYGEDSETGNDIFRNAAHVLGRFYLRVELTPQTVAETLAPLLRGCIETGAFLCLANCETISPTVLSSCVLPLLRVYRAAVQTGRWELPYGPHGATVSVPVHPFFRIALSSLFPSRTSLRIATLCETVRIASPDIAELLHSLFTQRGVISLAPLSMEELELGELYEQLREREPQVFTIRQLHMIVRDMIASGDGAAQGTSSFGVAPPLFSLSRRFLKSLMHINCGAFQGDSGAAFHKSLAEQIKAKLLLPSCKDPGLQEWFAGAARDKVQITFEEGVERFATLIELHRRVLIIGPRFSGKSELWKKWVGGTPSLILFPRLMTASDFYGSGSQRGFLAQMESQIALSKERKGAPIVVLEGVDAPSSFQLFAHTWFSGTRTPEGATNGSCVVTSPSLRVIATAVEVHHINPGVIDGFAMLALAGASCWRGVIKWALSPFPEMEAARKVLEVLLPLLVDRAAKMSPDILGSASELTNMCAIAQRAASLCSRWYTYALTIRIHRDVLASQDDNDEVDLRLFAARCAVMAASWSVGLSLPSEDRDAVKVTLLAAEADVMKTLADTNLSGEVFPQLAYNSVSPLEQVVLPQGWMSFEDAAKRTDLPLSWSGYRNVNPQLQTSLQVFATPSRVATLRSLECLINCGQHVMIHAGSVSGKSTLLHTTRTSENWVTQVFQVNEGFRATEVQQTMARALTKRSNGRYGPPLGRRLVVCIDDLHLSPPTTHGDCAPLAGYFISCCEKFGAVSTPTLGTVPVADVVFCASTLLRALSHEGYSVGASSGCVDVLLPPFDGDEIASGLLQLCDMASSRKRAKGFPQECVAFLHLAHITYCELKRRCTPSGSLSASTSVSFVTQEYDGRRGVPVPLAAYASEAPSADSGVPALPKVRPLFSEHLRELLAATEVVRLLLLSTVSDFQVSARVFIGVTTFYDELLSPSTNGVSAQGGSWSSSAQRKNARQISHEFRSSVVQAAEETLRNSVRGNVEFCDLAQELPEGFSRDVVSAQDESYVAQCITIFQGALEEEEETDLSALADRQGAHAAMRTHRSGSTIRAETRHASVLFSYPDSLKVAAVRAEGPNKEVYVRRSSTAVAVSATSSRRVSSVSTVMSEMSSTVAQHQPPSSVATPTYQTTWLTTRFIHLNDSLSVPGSHLLLLGENTFGMRRLFRLWCASSHVPFMWFRVNAADTGKAVVETFVSELRATVSYVCCNSVHAVAYLPPPLLRMPEVLRVIDAIVRSGDVSSLFTDEERFALLNGSGAARVRSLKPFVLADDFELRDRVRGSINFVFHLRDAAEARQLGEGYHFLLQPSTTSLPLYTDKLETMMLEEIALGILHNSEAYTNGIRKLEDEDDAVFVEAATDGCSDEDNYGKRLSPRAACTALCAVFACVRNSHPATVEQFMAFVHLYKELDSTARVQVLASARTSKIIAGRADAAVQAVNAATQRSRAIAEELEGVQLKLALLTEKLTGQERQHASRVAEAEETQKALQKMRIAIKKVQDAVNKEHGDAREEVANALKQLRKAKSGTVRALSMSRLPDKGTLLVRALYTLLGEEVPKPNDNPSELWTLSMKRMCTKEFIGDLAKAVPENSTLRLSLLLPFRRELDVVRYAPALPYAQLLADFVVAWIDCVRFLAEDYTVKVAEIARMQQGYERDEVAYQENQREVAQAETVAAKTRAEVAEYQKSLAVLQREQNDLAGSEGRLLKYTGLVDRFTRFLVGPASVPERVKRAQCATGDTLFVAAFYTLLAVYEDAPSIGAKLQEVLTGMLPGTILHFSPAHEVCAQLLYQTHAPRTVALTEAACTIPWEYKAILLSLYQRRASRWTLIGGSDPVMEHELRKFLALCCTGSVTVSATDPLAKERLVAAMRAGEGVLLRDVHGPASLDLVRSLNPIYRKLKEFHASLRQLRWAPKGTNGGGNAAAAALSQFASKKMPLRPPKVEAARPFMSVWFDGQEVPVHPQFFLVCTCFPALTHGLPEALESVDVFNLHRPLTHDTRLEWLIYAVISKPSISTKIASMQEEVQTRLQVYFEVLQDFTELHDRAAGLLATDLRDISGNRLGDALLAEMEWALAQVDTYDGQMAQTASYVQSLQRVVQEGWDIVFPAVKAVARATEQIERNRLGRPWHALGVASCIAGIAELSPALIRRIAPLSFSDLPIGQKCFYTLTQYVQRVVELLAPGWPPSLRGVFSLSILCTTISAATTTFTAESRVRLLTNEQRRILARLVYDSVDHDTAESTGKLVETGFVSGQPSLSFGGLAAGAQGDGKCITDVLRQFYATSSDSLLRRLAGALDGAVGEEAEDGFDAASDTSYDVVQFFTALLELDIEQADSYAASLYSTFMSSVTGLHRGAEWSLARVGRRESVGERPRTKSITSLHFSSISESGLEGNNVTSVKQTASKMNDNNNVLQAEVPSIEAQIQRAIKARLPLCIVSESHTEDALTFLQDEIKETKWAFQWHELAPLPSTAASPGMVSGDAAASLDMRASLLHAFEEVTQLIVSLACGPCSPESCGVCLTLVVDVKADASSGKVAPADLLLFREQWHRLLTLYSTNATLHASSGAAPMMCLVVVCNIAGQRMIWGQTAPDDSTSLLSSSSIRNAETVPCCYFALPAYTPRLALIELLHPSRHFFTKDGALQVCDCILQQVQAELASRSEKATSAGKRTTRVRGQALAKQNASRGAAALSIPLPELPPDLSTGALTALHKAAAELRSSTRLLQYEITVAYVASTTRLHLLYPSDAVEQGTKKSTLGSHTAERKRWGRHIYHLSPLLRLHTFLSAWVRQRYGELVAQLGGSPSTGVSTSETGAVVTPAVQEPSVSSLPLPIRIPINRAAGEGHLSGYGMQAYYYLRRNQPAWGLLLQKAERLLLEGTAVGGLPSSAEVTIDVLNPVLCSVMFPPVTQAEEDENPSPPSLLHVTNVNKAVNPVQQARQQQQELLIEAAGTHWISGLFVLARVFALYYLCAREARGNVNDTDSTLPLMEQRAQWEMLRTVIGTGDGADEVSFMWGPLANGGYTDMRKWHEVRISVRHPDSFRTEVAVAATDLMELCGEASAIEQFREMRQRLLVQTCFSLVVQRTAASKMIVMGGYTEADADAEANEALHDEAGSEKQEAAIALFVLRDTCEATNADSSATAAAAVSPVTYMLEWESSSLYACGSQPVTLNQQLQHMVQSFTFAIAPRKINVNKLPSSSFPEFFDPRLIHLWLPALRHPLFDLHYLTRAVSNAQLGALVNYGAIFPPQLQCSSRLGDGPYANLSLTSMKGSCFAQARILGGVATALVVVVTQQRFLSSSDVVLSGARLSPSLLRQIRALTGWEGGTVQHDNGASSARYTQSVNAEDAMVIAVRRVFIRQSKAKVGGNATGDPGDLTQAPRELGSGRRTPVEVGMHVRWADPVSSGLVWCNTVCVQAAVEGALWDTGVLCRPKYNDPVSRSLSTAHSGSFLPASQRASENFFVTEQDGQNFSRRSQVVSAVSARHTWSFSDAPIPVRWSGAHDVAELGVVEFPVCLEYDQPCEGGLAGSTFFSAKDNSVKRELGDRKAVDDDVVVGSVFPVQETLDTYLWIG